jgi:hypothetical protein
MYKKIYEELGHEFKRYTKRVIAINKERERVTPRFNMSYYIKVEEVETFRAEIEKEIEKEIREN